MNDHELRELFSRIKTIAVIGAKDKPGPVDRVGRYLIGAGYTVYPVHPVRKEVWGLPVYPTLADIPVPIDVVDVFRAPEFCPAHAEECAALAHRPLMFWMQSGISNEQARATAQAAGIRVVEDACLMVELQRLFPLGPKR